MSLIKKILLAILVVFIIIQFIRPAHNKSEGLLLTDITKIYNVPDSIQVILKRSCYDCHSNNTKYPWYDNIQPIGWLLAKDIKKGKEELNFSEFGAYSVRRQNSKLQAIENSIKHNVMPLSSYTVMHKNAKLLEEEKTLIIDWAAETKSSIKIKKSKKGIIE